jgi:hypothetical protein
MLSISTKIYNFLNYENMPHKSDIIIGFGHFDYKIADRCVELYLAGYAPKILFTGGVGAGSTGLSEPEGLFFMNYCLNKYPSISANDIIIETKSTNTGENIRFSQVVLEKLNPNYSFQKGINAAILVATPYRQLRVVQTMALIYPHIKLFSCPPNSDYESNKMMFAEKGEDFEHLLKAELKRIIDYPALGFIKFIEVPLEFKEWLGD